MDKKNDSYYCGAGIVPKNKERGPAEYCVRNNQYRYWGIKSIDKNMLAEIKKPKPDLQKERNKFDKIKVDAGLFVKEVKLLQLILEQPKLAASEKKKAEKRLAILRDKKDALSKKLKDQYAVLKRVEAEADALRLLEEKAEKRAAKEKKARQTARKEAREKEARQTARKEAREKAARQQLRNKSKNRASK